jgi:hypothetical protein
MELLQDPVVAADGFTYTPTTPLLPSLRYSFGIAW